MKDLTGKLCTHLFITLGGPLPPDSYGSLVNPPLGLLPQSPAQLGQVEGPGTGNPAWGVSLHRGSGHSCPSPRAHVKAVPRDGGPEAEERTGCLAEADL